MSGQKSRSEKIANLNKSFRDIMSQVDELAAELYNEGQHDVASKLWHAEGQASDISRVLNFASDQVIENAKS